MDFYCQGGAETLVCAQQPEVAEKQLHGETCRGSAALSQTRQSSLAPLRIPLEKCPCEYHGTREDWIRRDLMKMLVRVNFNFTSTKCW